MPARSYSAFLSYSHDDNREEGRRWAQWLQEQLETYVVPPDLVGALNDQGEKIPASLYPVFRDRLELRVSAQGGVEIAEALANSHALVVICSPRSARKNWVQKEIQEWQQSGRADRIFPVMIDGDPLRDAFPPELDPAMAIAADLRPGGRAEQGCTTAAAYRARLEGEGIYATKEIERRTQEYSESLTGEVRRLVAGLLDIAPGVLEQRDMVYRAKVAEEKARGEQARRIQIEKSERRFKSALKWVVLLGSIALVAGGFGWYQTNEKSKQETEAARVQGELAAESARQAGLAQKAEGEARTQQGKAESATRQTKQQLAAVNLQLGNQARGAPFSNSSLSPVMATWHLLESAKSLEEAGDAEKAKVAAFAAQQASRHLVQTIIHTGLRGYFFNHKGSRILTCGEGKVRQWSSKDGAPVGKPLEIEGVDKVIYSPDDTRILTMDQSRVVRQWDADSGAEVGRAIVHLAPKPKEKPSKEITDEASMEGGDPVDPVYLFMQYHPAGDRILTAGEDGAVRVWDAVTGLQVGNAMQHEERVMQLEIHKDGTKILTNSLPGTARQWDIVTGKPVGPVLSTSINLNSVNYSPDGKRILGCETNDQVRQWSAQTGKPYGRALHLPDLRGAEYSKDGKNILAWSGTGVAGQWDAETLVQKGPLMSPAAEEKGNLPELTARLQNPAGFEQNLEEIDVIDARYLDGAETILISSSAGLARLYHAKDSTPKGRSLKHSLEMMQIVADSSGRYLLTWEGQNPRLWDTGNDAELDCHFDQPVDTTGNGGPSASGLFQPNGTVVLTSAGYGCIRLWKVEAGSVRMQAVSHGGAVSGAAFDKSAGTFLSYGEDGAVSQWSVADGQAVEKPIKINQPVQGAVFSPDGVTVLTWNEEGAVAQWNRRTGKRITNFFHHGAPLPPIDPAQDQGEESYMARKRALVHVGYDHTGEKILSCSGDGLAKVWESRDGRLVASMKMPDEGAAADLICASFSPDAKRVLACGHQSGMALQWSAVDGRPVGEAMRFAEFGSGAVYSFDGSRVLTCSLDHVAQQWSSNDGSLIEPALEHAEPVFEAVYNLDATRIFTQCRDGKQRQWDARSSKLIGRPVEALGGGMTLSPDGKWLLTTSESAALLQCPDDLGLVATFPHTLITSASFAPDMTCLMTVSGKDVRIWDLTFDAKRTAEERMAEFQARSATHFGTGGTVQLLSEEEWVKAKQDWEKLRTNPSR